MTIYKTTKEDKNFVVVYYNKGDQDNHLISDEGIYWIALNYIGKDKKLAIVSKEEKHGSIKFVFDY